MPHSRRGPRLAGFIPQIIFLIILPLTILVLVVALGGISLHQQAMRDMASQQDLRTLRSVAANLAEQLGRRQDALQILGAQLTPSVDPKQLLASTDSLGDLFDGGVAFYDRKANLVAASPDYKLDKVDRSEIDLILATLPDQAQTPINLAPKPIPNPGKPDMLVMAGRLTPDMEILGAYTFDPLARAAISPVFSSADASFTVLDENGQVLYQNGPPGSAGTVDGQPGMSEVLRGESGVTSAETTGIDRLVVYTPVPGFGWGLVAEDQWQASADPYLSTTQNAPLVLVPVLILALIALLFGVTQIVGPLRKLEGQADDLAVGNFRSLEKPVGGITEIRNLQASMESMAQRMRSAQESLHHYIAAITNGQEEERRRLARDLHDDTLQAIIALNQRVQLARMKLNGHQAGQSLGEIQSLSEQAVVNLRRLMQALRPVYLEDLGLAAALRVLAQNTEKSAGIPVSFEIQGAERRLPPEHELALYRIAQEALNNVSRHAQAQHAWVNLAYSPEQLLLEVRDDGRGFSMPDSTAEFSTAGHFGLLGLAERAELVGAALEIDTAPAKGTRVRVIVPIVEPAPEKATLEQP